MTTTERDPGHPFELADRVSREFLIHHRMCPVGLVADGALMIAISEESLLSGLDDLSVAYGRPVMTQSRAPHEIDLLIARLTSAAEEEFTLDASQDEDRFISDIRDLANQPPVVRYVNLLLREACEAGASDVHLESTRGGLATRFRVDGVLLPAMDPPGNLERAVVSRLKLLAELDIAERRRPQDGRIRIRLRERELDLRVSTVPSVHGESVVLRLLERGGQGILLDDLGLSAANLSTMRRLVERPNGLILVTGPTGSGKTTTLYAALGLRSPATEKIITLEDPVEYTLPGVTQVPVHAQTGVTFASMLRSILRQDPDVILVGEMRDKETAELAVQAALTGHVVFSTLHTNDAVGAIPRLLDLGIAPYLVSATLKAVLAQRLVRKVCNDCREPYAAEPSSLELVDAQFQPRTHAPLTRGAGCPVCRGTGYRSRTGLFELLELTDDVRDAVAAQPSRQVLDDLAREHGMTSMRHDGWAKVRDGLTTIEEVLRVTQA